MKMTPVDQKSSFPESSQPKYGIGYLGGVKAQILNICPRAEVYGDCKGSIRDVVIHEGSVFHLDDETKELHIVNSEICSGAHIYAGARLDDARVKGTMRGGEIKNTTIRRTGEMSSGFASDADIYGRMDGGYIHKTTICSDGVVSEGQRFNNQNIGQNVPFHRLVKDIFRSGIYNFFSTTGVGKGKVPEKLPSYPEDIPNTAPPEYKSDAAPEITFDGKEKKS